MADEVSRAQLDPQYRYLRVQMLQDAPALLVLGYVDPHPLGAIEVWYSGSGEVLKLQNGRVVATQGLTLDWPLVRFQGAPVGWNDIDGSGSQYTRIRDEIPRYRYGLIETVMVRPVAAMPHLEGLALRAREQPQRYRWFQETVHGADGASSVSWFALGTYRGAQAIVFSEQCMAPTQCLRIQPWPADEGSL